MPNQMIALQARAPQTDILGGAIQRNAQMMNMMAQQQAAQRQADLARQKMQFDAAQEARAAREANINIVPKVAEIFRDNLSLAGFGNVEGIRAARQQVIDILPQFDKIIPPAEVLASDQNRFNEAYMTAKQLADKRFGTAITKEMVTPEGDVYGANISAMPGYTYMSPAPDISKPLTGGAPQRGAAPAPVGPAAPAPALPNDRAAILRNLGQPLPPEIMRQNGIRPMSETTAAPDLGAIIQNATQTGVVSQSDFDVLRQAAQGKEDQLAQIMKANNIRIMPDEDTGGFRSAVYRPDEAPAAMQEAQYDPNAYGRTRVKSPMQSPMPGSAIVPLPRVRAEAQAQRETPGEAAAKARATAAATAEVTRSAEEAKKLPAKRQVSTLIDKVRQAYEALETAQAIPSEKRNAMANIWDYMSTSAPGREVQKALGTQQTKHLSTITNSRKLLATAIKNATGMSAQEMNSNTELQLMLDALTDPTQGIEAARSTLDTLDELYGTPSKRAAPQAAPAAKAKSGGLPPDIAKQYGL